MKDYLGNELVPGMKVAVACYDRIKGAKLLKGTIVKFIKDFANVALETEPGRNESFLITPNRTIVIK